MKTTKEKIEVMQAYERGEQIQILDINCIWEDIDTPYWNWAQCDYRVKPKKKYVPFDTAEEFLDAKRKHGKTIKRIEDGMIYCAFVDEEGCLLLRDNDGKVTTIDILCGRYVFADGTPCGKEVLE